MFSLYHLLLGKICGNIIYEIFRKHTFITPHSQVIAGVYMSKMRKLFFDLFVKGSELKLFNNSSISGALTLPWIIARNATHFVCVSLMCIILNSICHRWKVPLAFPWLEWQSKTEINKLICLSLLKYLKQWFLIKVYHEKILLLILIY